MNEKQIAIKEQRRDWLVKGVLTLILMLVSLFVALLPLLSTFAKNNGFYFYAFGGVAFAALTALFVFTLVKECKPNVILTLNARGFVDKKNIGEDVEIEWTNVSSVKILGKTDMPFLGITLENNDIVIARAKKAAAEEMRENIEEGLPAILIAQNEVRMSIKELKDLFAKFVREARALESDIPPKNKNNPFSSDDVLRAFGKLPSEGTDTNAQTIVVPSATEESTAEEITDNLTEVTETTECTAPRTVDNATEKSKEEFSTEMQDLLSKAKSSRIDELGKMLTNDAPLSYQRVDNIADDSVSEVGSPEVAAETEASKNTDEPDLNVVPNILVEDKNDDNIELSIPMNEEKENEPQFEITLDSMIENALHEADAKEGTAEEPEVSEKKNEIPELATLLNDLDKKSQKKKKSFVLHEKD